jgi:flavorubredoxin
MIVGEIRENVFSTSVKDWDRRLFDELIPLPEGTTYNSYLIKGKEKTALIDTVYTPRAAELLSDIKKLGVAKLDYVICNHAEQDHSGSIPKVLEAFPDSKVVTNPKCKGMLMDSLLVADDRFMAVNDRETLSLGDRTLEFIYAPWVHWPETMFTYLREDKILFTCDFLGSHLATSSLFVDDEPLVERAAKRYYAEIMMPFRVMIKNNLEKIKGLSVEVIATSHGPIYDKPDFILNLYREWVSDQVKNVVVIPYVSMYGDTGKMVNYLVETLAQKGITVKPFNLTATDIGELAMCLVDAATIVVGSPTVFTGPHPVMAYGAYLINALRPKTKFATVIGSYGWGSKMLEDLKSMLSNLKVELLEPVIVKGHPKNDDFKALDRLAENILEKHKALGVTSA